MVTPDKAVELLKPYLFSPCFTKEFQEAYALAVETLEAKSEATERAKTLGRGGHSTKWCPICWADMTTLATRTTVSGLLRRRRYCPKCDKRFWTLEILAEDAPEELRLL